jgi:two-component system, NtrC family, sensor kinase
MNDAHSQPADSTNPSLLASVIADSHHAVAIVSDTDDIWSSRIVYANEACATLLGSTEMLSGRPAATLAGERPDLPLLLGAWSRRDGKPMSIVVHRHTGDRLDVELQVSPVHASGSLAYLAIVLRDVTERNRERAQGETERLLKERMTSVTYLAEGAAYEIHNPLSRVLACLELARAMLRGDPSQPSNDAVLDLETIDRSLDEAIEGGRRIRKLVDGLHAFARDGHGTTDTFDVHESLELALELTAAQLDSRARVERDYAALPPVHAPFARLSQAFIDVLTNASEAIPAGSPAGNHVRIKTSLDSSGRAVIEISDTGVGIEPGDLPHVFEPFFTSKPRPVSLGLGLSVAHGAIRASQGELSIESDVGRGTRVRITLETVAMAPPQAFSPRAPTRATQFILIVDRDPRVCAALSLLLENDRATVAHATPEDAWERMMLGREPDLIVLPVHDDEPPGWGFRERIERMAPHLSSRVVEIAFAVPEALSGSRDRLESSTQLSSSARVSA